MIPATLTFTPRDRAIMRLGVSAKAKSTAPAASDEIVVADPSPPTILPSNPASFQNPLSMAT
jgi:hypothetical protein